MNKGQIVVIETKSVCITGQFSYKDTGKERTEFNFTWFTKFNKSEGSVTIHTNDGIILNNSDIIKTTVI